MRDLGEVLDKMITISENIDLTDRLKAYQESVSCAAPEMQGFWWMNIAEFLEGYFSPNVELQDFQKGSWQEKIYIIWMNISEGDCE
jgi:hypothetical protein